MARAGRSGIAISFVIQYDVGIWLRIEEALAKKADRCMVIEEAMVFAERVGEAQRQAILEIKNLHEDKTGSLGAAERRKRNGKRGMDEMDQEEV
ncbi:ribosomal RNA processing protein [Monascus purpureus]|nr:ribosomal RNA processing protein [Monascus purpureus]